MTVIIILPSALNTDLINQLQSKILSEFSLSSDTIFEIRIDQSLVLGYKLIIGTQVYDKSFQILINTKLANIQDKIQ
jgi:F0F1-type ATP synthase delta subunit